MAKAKKAKSRLGGTKVKSKAKAKPAKKPRVSRGKPKPKPAGKAARKPTKPARPTVVAKSAGEQQALIKILNEDRAFELAAVMQYMGHYYEAEGLAVPEIMAEFKKASIEEMKHCEVLAERIVFLGGVPTYLPMRGFRRGGDIRKMLQDDLEVENEAIKRYRVHIQIAQAAGDSTTRLLLEKILADEEEHANLWQKFLA